MFSQREEAVAYALCVGEGVVLAVLRAFGVQLGPKRCVSPASCLPSNLHTVQFIGKRKIDARQSLH